MVTPTRSTNAHHNRVIRFLAFCIGLLAVLPVAAFIAALQGVSLLASFLSQRLERRPAPGSWRALVEYDPGVGWKPKADIDTIAVADFSYRLTTGSDGWRGTVSFAESDAVVFGDSFAFGHGCDDRRMFVRHTGRLTVKPIGADGYQMVHGLLWMRRLQRELRGKTVFWFVYYGNDLHENLTPSTSSYRMPFARELHEGWEIVTDHISEEPWEFPHPADFSRYISEYSTPGRYSDRVFSCAAYLVTQAQQLCREVDARLVVVGIPDRSQLAPKSIRRLRNQSPAPDQFDLTMPDRRLRDICNEVGASFVALSDHLTIRDYLAVDIHWNAAGHRKVGRVIAEVAGVQKHRSVPAEPEAVARVPA